MTKRMKEILDEIKEKHTLSKALLEGDEKDIEKAGGLLDEADELQKEYDLLERIEAKEKKAVIPEAEKDLEEKETKKKISGFLVVAKMINRRRLSDEEAASLEPVERDVTEKTALVYGGSSGEGYLLPEDVRYEINELRKQYKSAKDLVTVIPTEDLAGGFNYETGTPAGLTELTDGNDVTEETGMGFTRKNFAIKFFAKLIPISRILAGAEKAGLMGYINRWFIKNAIISENSKIFDVLAKKGANSASPVNTAGWAALKKKINTALDPDALYDAVIVTNQTGFDLLDQEVDGNGRPILQPDPSNATRKMFNGLPIEVFSNAQLADITSGTKAPMFVGSLKAGATFVDYSNLEFAVSEHALFKKNQNCMRVIEGFDVIPTDTSAYLYLGFSATPAAAQ